MNKPFAEGDRVCFSDRFFWAKGAMGTVSAVPNEVKKLSSEWNEELTREENSALGTHTVYWIWFDEVQFDADGRSSL